MEGLSRFGSIFILFAIVDYISFTILGIVSYIQHDVFPYQLYLNTFSILLLGIGCFMCMDVIKALKFNPISVLKHVFSTHYTSLLFLAIFSGIIAIASNFNELSVVRGLIYFAIWSSGRSSN